MLDSISVSGGRIESHQETARRGSTLEDIAGEASAASLSGPYKVSASYSFEGRTQELRFSTSAPDAAGLFRIKSALRDPERSITYLLDGDVTGLAGKPLYDGTIVVRVANAAPDAEPDAATARRVERRSGASSAAGEQTAKARARPQADTASFFELKGPLKATPDHAELPDFDLIIHAKGRPQIIKGRLALDFAEQTQGRCRAGGPLGRSRCAVRRSGRRRGRAAFAARGAVSVRRARCCATPPNSVTPSSRSLSSRPDLAAISSAISTVALAAGDGERQDRASQGDASRQESHRGLRQARSHGKFGPVFAGPVKLEGSGLRALSRWGSGDRDVSSQASMGNFTLSGERHGRRRRAHACRWRGRAERHQVPRCLEPKGRRAEPDRVVARQRQARSSRASRRRADLAILASGCTGGAATKDGAAPEAEPNLLAQLHDDDVRVTLRVGELLLPNIPAGRLDAGFTLISDTLDVQQLDFAAADAIALERQGSDRALEPGAVGRRRLRIEGDHHRRLAHRRSAVRAARGREPSRSISPRSRRSTSMSVSSRRKRATAPRPRSSSAARPAARTSALIGRAVGDPAKLDRGEYRSRRQRDRRAAAGAARAAVPRPSGRAARRREWRRRQADA